MQNYWITRYLDVKPRISSNWKNKLIIFLKSLFSHPAKFIKPAAEHDVVDDLLLQHSNNTQAAITTHNYFCDVL